MNLIYSLDKKYIPLYNDICESGELSDEQLNELRSIEDDPKNKAINDAAIIKNLEAEKEGIQNAINDMERRHDILSNKIERLKFDLNFHMQSNSLDKIKTPQYEIRLKMNPPGTNIFNEALIPENYIKETIVKKIDKIKIIEDIKKGVEVPGVTLEQKIRIEIK